MYNFEKSLIYMEIHGPPHKWTVMWQAFPYHDVMMDFRDFAWC